MRHYEIIMLDADGTLFDFNAAERKALGETMAWAGLPMNEELLASYHDINDELWKALEKRQVTRSQLLSLRFSRLLEAWGFPGDGPAMNEYYTGRLAQHGDLLPHAEAVCKNLARSHMLVLVTNGIARVQEGRLGHSPLRAYFTHVFTSEAMGYDKPAKAFFEACFVRLGQPDRSGVLVVGDSLSADMEGGIRAGLDTCWYNPLNLPAPRAMKLTYTITDLRELVTEMK